MKRILQRVAFFGTLGCLTAIAIASHNNFRFSYKQEWKGLSSTVKTEQQESLVESETKDNGYEWIWRGKIFNHFID